MKSTGATSGKGLSRYPVRVLAQLLRGRSPMRSSGSWKSSVSGRFLTLDAVTDTGCPTYLVTWGSMSAVERYTSRGDAIQNGITPWTGAADGRWSIW